MRSLIHTGTRDSLCGVCLGISVFLGNLRLHRHQSLGVWVWDNFFSVGFLVLQIASVT